jgi:cysteine desulfurase
MAAAAEFVEQDRADEQEREWKLRDCFWDEISRQIPSAVANGDSAARLANTLNVSFPELDSETMLMALDLEGVCASSGSACMVGSVVASHVLLAMGLSLELAKSAVRFSLGKFTTGREIDGAVRVILQIIQRTHARHIAQTEHLAIQAARVLL